MALKPNYRQQRGDRDRVKAKKKQDRLRRRENKRSDTQPDEPGTQETGLGSDVRSAPSVGEESTD